MNAYLVYDGGDAVHIPPLMGTPRHDQMHGTPVEQLIELSGRGCYDSLGTGRPSNEYHRHLIEVGHFSVHEHAHLTIETSLAHWPWLGVPDIVAGFPEPGKVRLTFNLRHVLEWPKPVTWWEGWGTDEQLINRWGNLLKDAAHHVAANLFPAALSGEEWELMVPERDSECFVSLFLEDSRVFSHEMVRHRFNMSQRSGRFCDETDRDYSIHPLFQQYLNEAGYLALNPEDGEKLWCETDLPESEIHQRTAIGNDVGSLVTQSRMVYTAVVDRLQDWLISKKGLDKVTARKQARSAGRYYLGNGLSTEMIYTASIRSWRGIFKQRVNPAADQAIHTLMAKAQELVKGSRYGHLL